jgi:hypothetical protein
LGGFGGVTMKAFASFLYGVDWVFQQLKWLGKISSKNLPLNEQEHESDFFNRIQGVLIQILNGALMNINRIENPGYVNYAFLIIQNFQTQPKRDFIGRKTSAFGID